MPPNALGGLGRSWRVVHLPDCSSMARAAPSAALPPPRLCGMAAPGRDSATWGGGTPPGALVPASTGAAAFLGRTQVGALADLRKCGCEVREHDMLLRLVSMRFKFLPTRVCSRVSLSIKLCRTPWAGAKVQEDDDILRLFFVRGQHFRAQVCLCLGIFISVAWFFCNVGFVQQMRGGLRHPFIFLCERRFLILCPIFEGAGRHPGFGGALSPPPADIA